jgi:hypothetical protein
MSSTSMIVFDCVTWGNSMSEKREGARVRKHDDDDDDDEPEMDGGGASTASQEGYCIDLFLTDFIDRRYQLYGL